MSRLLLVLVVGAALAMIAIGLVLVFGSARLERLGRELALDGLLLLIGLALVQVALAMSSLLGLSSVLGGVVRL